MPPVSFESVLKIDGEPFRARRLDGGRTASTTFMPQVQGQRASVQLDPLNESDWSDGRGWGQNVDTSEGLIMPGPQVTDVTLPSAPGADLEQFAEQDGHIYVVGGRYAYRIPNGSSAPSVDQDLGASFLAVSVVPFKNALYVGGRSSGNLWKKAAAGAWSNTMVAGAVQRGKLTTVWWNTGGGNSLRLIGEYTATNAITYVADDPMDDTDWVLPVEIGSWPIRSMVANRFHAYPLTTGGLFDLGSDGTAPNLTPEVEHQPMDSNGKASLAADGWIYFNAGYTLKRVYVIGQEYGKPQDCGWEAQLPRQCPMSGYCTALTRYGRWLWATIYDGLNTWVCKAREAASADVYGPLVWFVAPIVLPGVKVTALHVSGIVDQNPRLWMACNTAGTRSLKWAYLPLDSAYRDLRQARLYRFAASGLYDEPEEDHGDDALPKLLRELVAETENVSGSISDTLHIARDGESAYASVGTYKTSPRSVIKPVSTILASRYVLRHNLTGTSVTPPIIRKHSRRVIPRPDLLEVRGYQVVAGPATRFSDGGIDGRSLSEARRILARLQRIGPINLTDEFGTDLTVLVSAGETFSEMEATFGEAGQRRVLVADIQIAVLAGTGGITFKYGDGTKYGDPGKVFA